MRRTTALAALLILLPGLWAPLVGPHDFSSIVQIGLARQWFSGTVPLYSNHPPLVPLLVGAVSRVLGEALSARAVAAAAGTLLVAASAGIASALYGRKVGVVSAALLVVSPGVAVWCKPLPFFLPSLALALGSLDAALHGRRHLSGTLLVLAALADWTGALVALPLLTLPHGRRVTAAYLSLAALLTAAFLFVVRASLPIALGEFVARGGPVRAHLIALPLFAARITAFASPALVLFAALGAKALKARVALVLSALYLAFLLALPEASNAHAYWVLPVMPPLSWAAAHGLARLSERWGANATALALAVGLAIPGLVVYELSSVPFRTRAYGDLRAGIERVETSGYRVSLERGDAALWFALEGLLSEERGDYNVTASHRAAARDTLVFGAETLYVERADSLPPLTVPPRRLYGPEVWAWRAARYAASLQRTPEPSAPQ